MEILTSIEDINGNLDGQAVRADGVNTALIQVNVARWIKAYLSRTVDQATMATWDIATDPASVPDTIREIAGLLAASQVFLNATIETTTQIDDTHYSMVLYNRAMALLNGIVSGAIIIPVIETPDDGMSVLDFFPIDDTDRGFTLSKKFY